MIHRSVDDVNDDCAPSAVSQVGPWAMVPVWVLTQGLTGAELAVYVALRSFCDQSGVGYPTVKTIAARAGVSQRTAERALAQMGSAEAMPGGVALITTTRRYRSDGSLSGCLYYLRDLPPSPPAGPPPDPEWGPDLAGGPDEGDGGVPTRVTGGTDGGDGARKNTPIEHTKKLFHRTAGRAVCRVGGSTDTDASVQALVVEYATAVEGTGGIATSTQRGAVGRAVRRLLVQDQLPPSVVLEAVRRAGRHRSRAVEQFLGTSSSGVAVDSDQRLRRTRLQAADRICPDVDPDDVGGWIAARRAAIAALADGTPLAQLPGSSRMALS